MTRSQTTGFALVIAGVTASTLFLSTPAHAVPYTDGDPITVGGTTWAVNGTQVTALTAELGVPLVHTDLYAPVGTQASCLAADLREPDARGDVALVCDGASPVDGVSTLVRWDFFAEGDLARQVVTVRNGSDTAKPMNWSFDFKFESTPFQATSTKPTLAEPTSRLLSLNDTWTYNDSRAGVLGIAVAWGHPDASVPRTSALSGFIDQIISDPDTPAMIAPGTAVAIAFYYKIDPAGSLLPNDQIDVAAVTDEFASFDGRLVRGLPEGAIVQNWGTVPVSESPQAPEAPTTPELADTGSSDTAVILGVVALGGLIAGGALVLTRNRRTEPLTTV